MEKNLYIFLVTVMKKFVPCFYLHAINLRTLLTGASQHLLLNQSPSPHLYRKLAKFYFSAVVDVQTCTLVSPIIIGRKYPFNTFPSILLFIFNPILLYQYFTLYLLLLYQYQTHFLSLYHYQTHFQKKKKKEKKREMKKSSSVQ